MPGLTLTLSREQTTRSYMILSGHEAEPDHALRVLRAVSEMLALVRTPLPHGDKVAVRVGVNTGPAHSGVLGTRRFKYTVWGDT